MKSSIRLRTSLLALAVTLPSAIVGAQQSAVPADRPVPRSDQNSQTAHAELLEKARRGRIDVYFVGDSITRRWGALDYPELLANWRKNFFGWNAANFGWGADTTQNILWRLLNGELDGVNPKIVVVQAGTNNVGKVPGGDAKVDDVVRGIKAIVETCRAKAPGATIVLTALFPRNDNPAVWPEIVRINARISEFADGVKVRYVDVNARLADRDGTLFDGMTVDKLHPTVKGYQVWADALRPIFTEVLGPPAAVDLAPPPTGDPSARKGRQPPRESAGAENGYELWLRYRPLADPARLAAVRRTASAILAGDSQSAIIQAAIAELRRGLGGLLNANVPVENRIAADGAILVGTPGSSRRIASLGWRATLDRLGPDGYLIRSAAIEGKRVTVIASAGDAGVLYGAFHFLRLLQTGAPVATLNVSERPRVQRRLLNHWDNLDGTIERGYAGRSLWWGDGPAEPASRLEDYARANASIGINGAVINNVNANPLVLTRPYLEKAAALAARFRPYGIRVYLSANAAAPRMLRELDTADPMDPAVANWWRAKADEIYALIPDFGGFVVKANSEGQPGPQDYGRTHADGANVLADALERHGGVVMWRAFVYDASVDPDRVKRAYLEFVPLDGKFRGNVFVQVKNGPLDFQPREPFHPLFGAMPRTPLAAELQITQEYLGQSNHLVYLATMWKEFLDSDTYARGRGSSVSKVVDGTLEGKRNTAMVGVANTGRDATWTGHVFGQANWYAFGRLAWNPELDPGAIADEWIRMTWGDAPNVVAPIRSLMIDSRETYVRYTMPLGLHHLIGGNHYAPMPENADPRRADWSAVYYHRAGKDGIGFDRTARGSNAVGQYGSPLRERWNDPKTTPDRLLLWFHRLPWSYRMKSGETLWDALVGAYTRGAAEAREFESRWAALRGSVDEQRFEAVAARLRRQAEDAAAWRDKCLRYFHALSGGTLPAVVAGDARLAALLSPVLVGAAIDQRQSDGADAVASSLVAAHFNTATAVDVDVLPREPGMDVPDPARRPQATASNDPFTAGLPRGRQQALAARYSDIFALFAKHRRVLGRVTFWGVTDASSWLNNFPVRGRTNYPLLWDRDGKPKLAFDAVIDVLRR